jgi:prepilin-type N-terminal cleavage/methylation domain-containing protein
VTRQRRHPRSFLRRLATQDGFTLIETLMALTLFASVSAPLMGVLMASAATQGLSRERTLAEQAAQAQIETVRAIPYASVGTTDGNPPGSIAPTRRVVLPGLVADVATRVSFMNDPTPTAYVTYADYKRVTVTVSRASDAKVLTRATTYVAPPGRSPYAGVNDAIVKATVIDYALNQPVENATVTLSGGPSPTRNDFTDSSGAAIFPSLVPNPVSGTQMYYDLNVTATGYQTLRDDAPPALAAHTKLSPGQTFTTVLRIYRPATMTILLRTASGAAYTSPANVTVGSPRAAQTFSVTGGALTLTQLGGEPLVPGLRYTVAAQTPTNTFAPAIAKAVPNAYPTDLTSSYTLTVGSTPLALTPLTVKVTTAAGVAVKNARVDVNGGPVPVYLTGVTDATGAVTIGVPAGTGYTVSVTGSAGEGTGQWAGSVTRALTTTVKVA